MCTTAVKHLDNTWFLAKTRDPVPYMRRDDEIKLFDAPVDKYKKLIIQNPNPNEDGYYGWINDQGVAFISTFVWVTENQVSYIRRPYVRLILDAATAKEAVEIIQSFNPRIGGNMFVADATECYGIEWVPEEYFVEKIADQWVKTNHFVHFPYENLQAKTNPRFKQWTHDRYDRANELLSTATNKEDLKLLLQDRKNAETKTAICTIKSEEECCTYSAFIFDTRNKKALYCQGNPLENEFKEFWF
jgi:hypothetical protein